MKTKRKSPYTTHPQFAERLPAVMLESPVRGFRIGRPRDLVRLFAGDLHKLQAAEEALAQVDFQQNDDIEAPIGTKRKKVHRMLKTYTEPSRGYFAMLFKYAPPKKATGGRVSRVKVYVGGVRVNERA